MPAIQIDLFAAPILPGLAYADNLTTPAQEKALGHIDACALAPFRFEGWLGERLTASLAGAMISTTLSSGRPRASPTGFSPRAIRQPRSLGWRPTISSRRC